MQAREGPPEREMDRRSRASHCVYGITLRGPRPLCKALARSTRPPDLVISHRETPFTPGDVSWFHCWQLPDGRKWLSAGRHREGGFVLRFHEDDSTFRVSADGARIACSGTLRSVRHFLFNQVIPMVMNHRGIEVLHASSILTPRGAIAFVGNGGFGKSSLAACFLKQGFRLLSDDAVPLYIRGAALWTSSGVPEVNLWPRARALLNPEERPAAGPAKRVMELDRGRFSRGDHPLKRIIFLQPKESQLFPELAPLRPRDALLSLVKAAHRLDLEDRERLKQQLARLHEVVQRVESRVLTYSLEEGRFESAWLRVWEELCRGPRVLAATALP